MPDVVQTFYMDPAAVGGSPEAFLTSIDVYFKSKPSSKFDLNWEGLYDKLFNQIALPPEITDFEKLKIGPGPGAILRLIPNSTNLLSIVDKDNKSSYNGDDVGYYYSTNSILENSLTRVPITSITASSDASIATSFVFQNPIKVKTGISYAMIFSFESDGFELWSNKKGHKIVGTNNPSSGTNSVNDGKYFTSFAGYMNDKQIADTTLKYRINVAKFVQANTGLYEKTIELVNKNYEFLTVNSKTGTFKGGEYVFQNTALSTGTLNIQAGNNRISGTSTTFDSLSQDCYIAAFSGGVTNILKIESVDSNTSIRVIPTPSFTNSSATFSVPPIGKFYYSDEIEKKVFLIDSSSNSTIKFTPGSIIRGEASNTSANIVSIDDYSIDRFTPKLNIETSMSGNVDLTYALSYSNGSQYITSSFNGVKLNAINDVSTYDGYIRSRANEVSSSYLYGSSKKSGIIKAKIKVNTSNSSVYSSPIIKVTDLDMFMMKNKIDNTYTSVDANSVTFDTEVYRNGLAKSKHLSTKISFANNRFSEDLRVYLTGYRPLGTQIKVYAKIHNSGDPEAFDDKLWTPLEVTDNANAYSSSVDANNLIEYTYTLPKSPETAIQVPSIFLTEISNNVLASGDSSVTISDYLANGNIIKIHDPIIPENFMIASIESCNATHITLDEAISNTSFVGEGFLVDRVKYYNIGFNNPLNDNVARYYNMSGAEYDKFDAFQVKVVLLSDYTYIIPNVDSLQVIGLSA